ncbi:redoxin domain-containing protein [Chitinophaga sp. XS-30]|uniref:TlpA family protein disulfide reductase n=1 Tax=Chitinophaga sp. XS-30 TaxID=2604421 RepID=UPI0011DDEC57|nr:redoxin domain-containing protein [Chitinophaga sp. XS-30]QEH39453.1 redoxin domain-containing protein [Chitinophaga sp. XS-30]
MARLLPSFFLIVLFFSYGKGQSRIQQIKVGDKVPELVFGNMKNYYKDKANLSEFRSKLLIIDVWNRWCSSCINAFPKMERLQKIFEDKIAIILLTDDPIEEFNKLREKSSIVKNTRLPFSIEDTLINKLFPHKGVPMHIWIDTTGTAIAITSGYNTTEGTIRNYLNGNLPSMNRRDNDIIDFEKKKPLFAEGNGRQLDKLVAYSTLFGSLKNYRFSSSSYLHDSISKKIIGFRKLNANLPSLISFAYNTSDIILDFPEGEKYFSPISEDSMNQFVEKYQYSYEVKLPERWYDSISTIQKYLQEDICRYFNLKIKLENKKLLTYNLISTGSIHRIVSKNSNTQAISEFHPILINLIFKNAPILALTNGLSSIINKNRRTDKIAVNNNTGYSGNIDMEISIPDASICSINKALAVHNLMLIPKYEVKKVAIARLRD